MVSGQPEQFPRSGSRAEVARGLDRHHVRPQVGGDSAHAIDARPADELQRVDEIEWPIGAGGGKRCARPAPVGPAAVVADQLHDPLALRPRAQPERMRRAAVRPARDAHQVLVLRHVLPADAARLHPEGERWQGFVRPAVAVQVGVRGLRLGANAAQFDRRPVPRMQDLLHALDVDQSFRLLAARVGERDRIGPQACRTQGQQHRRGVHPGTEANHDQLAQERGTQGAALACID